jgi:hypothetical protein
MRLGYGGRHARQTGAMLSEKCAARRGRAWDGMRVSTVCFTRALQRSAGRTNMRFLFILQEVRAIGKTRNQFCLKKSQFFETLHLTSDTNWGVWL